VPETRRPGEYAWRGRRLISREADAVSDHDEHRGHDLVNLKARRRTGDVIGRRACLTCDLILGPLVLCGRPTKLGWPRQVTVRIDFGHTRCRSHGEGRGRTSTPRRLRRAS
jgi:hypothetical protein